MTKKYKWPYIIIDCRYRDILSISFLVDKSFFSNLENGLQEYQLVFFPSVWMCSWHFMVSKNTASINENTQPRKHQKNVEAPEFWRPGTRTLVPFQVDNRYFIVISRMGISNINLSFSQVYLCFPDFSWFYQNTVSICEDTQPRKHRKNCGGTRVLVPGHQNSGALSSWQEVFCFNLKNGHQEYHFVFFPKCIYVFPTFPVFIGTLSA